MSDTPTEFRQEINTLSEQHYKLQGIVDDLSSRIKAVEELLESYKQSVLRRNNEL